jgi:hypothetical protein
VLRLAHRFVAVYFAYRCNHPPRVFSTLCAVLLVVAWLRCSCSLRDK